MANQTFTLNFNRIIAEKKHQILVEATWFISQFVILDKADVLPNNRATGDIDDILMFDLESEALEYFKGGIE